MAFVDKTVYLCRHCGWRCTGQYCSRCDNAAKRKLMDAENKKINPEFVCKYCELGWYSVFTKVHTESEIKEN